jgi:hypothetical protein
MGGVRDGVLVVVDGWKGDGEIGWDSQSLSPSNTETQLSLPFGDLVRGRFTIYYIYSTVVADLHTGKP